MPLFVEQQLEPSKCRVILQSLPEAWLASLPPHAGCSKYYGRAVRLDDSGEMFVDPRSASVGLITNCLDPRDRTFAWEYAQQVVGANASSCTGAALYACVNADHSGCCSSLNTSISFYFVASGICCCAISAFLLLGALGAHLVTTRYLRNPALKHLVQEHTHKIKLMKVERSSCICMSTSMLVALLALGSAMSPGIVAIARLPRLVVEPQMAAGSCVPSRRAQSSTLAFINATREVSPTTGKAATAKVWLSLGWTLHRLQCKQELACASSA